MKSLSEGRGPECNPGLREEAGGWNPGLREERKSRKHAKKVLFGQHKHDMACGKVLFCKAKSEAGSKAQE